MKTLARTLVEQGVAFRLRLRHKPHRQWLLARMRV